MILKRADGLTYVQIGAAMGCSNCTAWHLVHDDVYRQRRPGRVMR